MTRFSWQEGYGVKEEKVRKALGMSSFTSQSIFKKRVEVVF